MAQADARSGPPAEPETPTPACLTHSLAIERAYRAALARRAAVQSPRLRAYLEQQLERLSPLHAQAADDQSLAQESPPSQLAALLDDLSRHSLSLESPLPDTPAPPPRPVNRPNPQPELKAVAYFREAWSRLSTEQQLTQTLAQAPENAGPMNSQHLVLRSLQNMRDISPDYLQGFMTYVDTLIWLEQITPYLMHPGRLGNEGEKKAKTGKRASSKRSG